MKKRNWLYLLFIVILLFIGLVFILYNFKNDNTKISILTAVATYISTVTAIISIFIAFRSLNMNTESVNKQIDVEKKSQASKVVAYIENGEKICIINSSELPIYNVVITILHMDDNTSKDFPKGENTWKENIKILKEGSDVPFRHQIAVYDIIPSGKFQKDSIYIPNEMGDWYITRAMRVEIAFMDSKSISWIRRVNGELEEIKDNPFIYYGVNNMDYGISKLEKYNKKDVKIYKL